jgi:hypothetical protein
MLLNANPFRAVFDRGFLILLIRSIRRRPLSILKNDQKVDESALHSKIV